MIREAWESADLEEVRRAMPDNLVWDLIIPTDDPAVIQNRREHREHWQREYGKVLSNTASGAQVDAYYAHQKKRSTDYIEFLSYILDNYSDALRENDIGLLRVAHTLHSTRLKEIPRRHAEALVRCKNHARAREAWLAEEAKWK